jgi:hypothetical protein
VLTRAGAQVVPCPVDSRGIVPGRLPTDLKLLYTTPAHQYPLGGRLPVARRQELIAWARATGALIVEDDYDSEFRYDVGPLPTLRGMDPGVVVYLGTTSKTLTPALGGGWLIAPPALVTELAGMRRDIGDRVPEPVQHAVLALLRGGDLERHVRKMRLEYARRRAAIVEILDGARILGDTAGMHVVVELPDAAGVERIRRDVESRGVSTLDQYFTGAPTRHGLVIGYGAAPLPAIREAATALRGLLRAALADGGGQGGLGAGVRDDSGAGHRDQMGAGQPVDVDGARPQALAFRYLGRAEVTAAGPPRARANDGNAAGQRWRSGRPLAGHPPGVEPAQYGRQSGHRTAGERLTRPRQDADLSTDPSLGAHPRDLFGEGAAAPVESLGRAERAPGPQDGDQLRDVAGHRIPHQVTGTVLGQ